MQLMHLEIKNSRIKVFRGKQAKSKVPLLYLDAKMLKGNYDRHFQTL